MSYTEDERQTIIALLRERPRTVQEIAGAIDRSWVTAERYITAIAETTGEIGLHTFRPGSRGAVKVAYYTIDALPAERIERRLQKQILQGRYKTDFDILDIAQRSGARIERAVKDDETHLIRARADIEASRSSILIFSGNLSFARRDDFTSAISDAIERGVTVNVLCRITAGTLANLERLPEGCTVRHCYQPLRGHVIDAQRALLTGFEPTRFIKDDELAEETVHIAAFSEQRWVDFVTRTFWSLWRTSPDGAARVSILEGAMTDHS